MKKTKAKKPKIKPEKADWLGYTLALCFLSADVKRLRALAEQVAQDFEKNENCPENVRSKYPLLFP